MKYLRLIYLSLGFLFVSSQISAIHPINSDWVVENEVKKDEVDKKNGLERLFKTKVGKWILKKIGNQEPDAKFIMNMAMWALIIGIASLVSLFSFTVWAYFWAIAFILAIIGDIISIRTLLLTRKNKSVYRKARTLAWLGLIASLLTGLLPLALLIIVLISL